MPSDIPTYQEVDRLCNALLVAAEKDPHGQATADALKALDRIYRGKVRFYVRETGEIAVYCDSEPLEIPTSFSPLLIASFCEQVHPDGSATVWKHRYDPKIRSGVTKLAKATEPGSDRYLARRTM